MISQGITLIPRNIPDAPLATEVIRFGSAFLGIELAFVDGDTAKNVKPEYRALLKVVYSWGRNSNGAHMKWTVADREAFSAEYNVPDLSFYTRVRRKIFERGQKRTGLQAAYDRSKYPKCATIYEFVGDEEYGSVCSQHGDSSSSSHDSWWTPASQSSGWTGWNDKRWSWGG